MNQKTGQVCFRQRLFLCMAVCVALLVPRAGNADTAYDRQAAVQYAIDHSGHEERDKCTVFVVNCLAAGGIHVPLGDGKVVSVHEQLQQYGVEYEAVLRNDLLLYNQDNRNLFEVGDIAFFYCETCASAPWAHTGIITRIGEDGKVYFSQNNPSIQNTQYWDYHHDGKVGYDHYGSSVWILHIGGTDELPAEPGGAKEAWEEACGTYGRVSLVNYGGEVYLDEGNGAALPLLCRAGGNEFLVVLVQQDETLSQVIYRIDGDGTYRQVFSDQTLTLGDRSALFLYAESGSALIASASLEDDMAAFTAEPRTVKKTMFEGDETAESIADMGMASWETFRTLYGNPEWNVRVDANYGLFHLQFSGAEEALAMFGIAIP